MPRQARIDAPGALNHIMARGIEKSTIFKDNTDRNNFLSRLGDILLETETACYAWALLPNHFHLLLRTGKIPISTIMRRLLTGYALWYNKKHNRHGHLFQNRYKSILCQEDAYFLELVRYIHLNPIRAGIIQGMVRLDRYKYCGHSALMAKAEREWQDTDMVLWMFGKKVGYARKAYRDYLEMVNPRKKRTDLSGGGLIRSAGGWEAVIELRNSNLFQKSDERILGDGVFVERVLKSANEALERKYDLQAQGFTLDKVAARVAEVLTIEKDVVWSPGRNQHVVKARSLLCYWAVRELGVTMSLLARKLKISIPAVSKSVERGRSIAKDIKAPLVGR